MMKFLVLLFLAGSALAHIDDDKTALVNDNRVPKFPSFGSVCSECESLIKRIVDVAQDPTKLAELKILLSALCHETSYEDECRVFVSKIDLFIRELLPYLKNPNAVCRDIHLCSNKKIDAFHRIGMLYAKKYLNKVNGANDLICEECQFAAHELQQVVDNHQIQVDVRRFLSQNVCEHLGQYRGSCDVLLDDFLPEMWQELHNLLQEPREFCEHVKLCQPTSASLANKEKKDHDEVLEPGAFRELMQRVSSTPFKHDPSLSSASCIECRIAVDTILLQLGSEETSQSLADDLRDGVCPVLPANWYAGCLDFLNMYAQTVVKMTVGQFSANQVCTAIHACEKRAFEQAIALPALKPYSCDACKEVSKLLEVELESRLMRRRLVHEAKHFMCDRLPGGLKYPCDNLTRNYVPLALNRLMQRLQNAQICEAFKVCKVMKD